MKGDRIQRFSFLLFVMPFFLLTLFIQAIVLLIPILWWIEQMVMLLLFIILEMIAGKRLNRRLIRKEFLS